MKDHLLIDPTFAVPLDATQLHDLGVLAVLWGQIDFMLDEILAHLHAFDEKQRAEFLTEKMIGAKVEMLAKGYARLPEELHDQAKDLVRRINNLKQRRNTAFHGVWGWHLEKRSKTRQPAAFHHKTKDNPVRSQDLRPMAREMIECSKVAGRITCALLGFDYVPAVQFTWGAGDKEPPEWLAKDYTQIAKGRRPQDRRTQ